MKSKRPNRSDRYQVIFNEIAYSNEMMCIFTNEDSMEKKLNPFSYNEEILELEDQLKKEFWRIVETLTDRQKEVIKLYAKGLTQMEIAKRLNVNQSSVTKSLHGNVDYKNSKRCYGGSERKLRKIIDEDPKIQEILRKIRELRDEQW